jgi:hypothetical protein
MEASNLKNGEALGIHLSSNLRNPSKSSQEDIRYSRNTSNSKRTGGMWDRSNNKDSIGSGVKAELSFFTLICGS